MDHGDSPRSGVHALLFTDVEDSTRQAALLGSTRAAEVWAAHDRRARDLLVAHDGREIGRADGMFLLFGDATRAAHYALDYRAAVAALGLAPRVGLHLGEVSLHHNAADDIARGAAPLEVSGLAVAVTARLMALASGGQVLLTRAAHDALHGKLPPGARVQSHGFYRIKGVEAPVEVLELGVDGASPFQPPADGEKAFRVVRDVHDWTPAANIRHNLAAERDAFVGREEELRNLAARFAKGARLVSVVGTGGAGKTRLSRRYARAWLGDWPGGVYFCDLSDARELDPLVRVVAAALDVPLAGGDTVAQLGHAIAGRGSCLLILDNVEQVLGPAAAAIGRWLDSAPRAGILVTSRERLQVPGEAVLPLEPLPVEREGVELFARRAHAQDPDFELTEANRSAILEVVRLLDGLPLAIELAAARSRVLAPQDLASRLRDRFRILAAGRGTGRHATLRSAIDWSWELLAPWERAALAHASVFEGDFTLDAAEAVLDTRAWREAPAAIDVVQSLVDKSLLHPSQITVSGARAPLPALGMYLSIREYAAEKLVEQGEQACLEASARHGAFYARLATEEALTRAQSRAGDADRATLLASRDNIIAACHRAATRGDAACAVGTLAAAWSLLEMQGPAAAALPLSEAVLAIDSLDVVQRLRALLLLGEIRRRNGDPGGSARALDEAQMLSASQERWPLRAHLLTAMAYRRADEGRNGEARAQFEAALELATASGDRVLQGRIHNGLGIQSAQAGEFDEAEAHFAVALTQSQEAGHRRGELAALANLANTLRMQERTAEATGTFERVLEAAREFGDHRLVGLATGNLGTLYGAVGRVEEAIDCCERSLALHRDVGNLYGQGVMEGTIARLLARQHELDAAWLRFDAAEQLLERVGDAQELMDVLVARAQSELDARDPRSAARTLARAEALLPHDADATSPGATRLAELKARLTAPRDD